MKGKKKQKQNTYTVGNIAANQSCGILCSRSFLRKTHAVDGLQNTMIYSRSVHATSTQHKGQLSYRVAEVPPHYSGRY